MWKPKVLRSHSVRKDFTVNEGTLINLSENFLINKHFSFLKKHFRHIIFPSQLFLYVLTHDSFRNDHCFSEALNCKAVTNQIHFMYLSQYNIASMGFTICTKCTCIELSHIVRYPCYFVFLRCPPQNRTTSLRR